VLSRAGSMPLHTAYLVNSHNGHLLRHSGTALTCRCYSHLAPASLLPGSHLNANPRWQGRIGAEASPRCHPIAIPDSLCRTRLAITGVQANLPRKQNPLLFDATKMGRTLLKVRY
jgi:hypothetical protein